VRWPDEGEQPWLLLIEDNPDLRAMLAGLTQYVQQTVDD
jgi:hypothetical protein